MGISTSFARRVQKSNGRFFFTASKSEQMCRQKSNYRNGNLIMAWRLGSGSGGEGSQTSQKTMESTKAVLQPFGVVLSTVVFS